ncbi:MAG: Gfo/Idh/MocA family oxidoreductase [Candidatus Lokiarchaeota archaeon]|nr:Gfo/Idh/MocA family oxidoreductase [Candidatus Lokiarchaeota archaeon]
MVEQIIKWGIIGCGKIAQEFVKAFRSCKNTTLHAVASQTQGNAKKFSKKFKIKTYYTDYESLVKDPNIDVIYIATTNNLHFNNTLLCLKNNKHVLCEKPFTLNAKQAEKLIKISKEKKRFLMEAMWMRFFPCIRELKILLIENIIGRVYHIKADFGINVSGIERLTNLNLGGGALLDLGVYPISFTQMIYQCAPKRIQSSVSLGDTKIDEFSSYLLEYENNKTAICSSSFIFNIPHTAYIYGKEGYIEVPDFFHPSRIIIHLNNKTQKSIEIPYESNGYNYEINEVVSCINQNKLESKIMPLNDTLEVIKTMDIIRAQWNLKYPNE